MFKKTGPFQLGAHLFQLFRAKILGDRLKIFGAITLSDLTPLDQISYGPLAFRLAARVSLCVLL